MNQQKREQLGEEILKSSVKLMKGKIPHMVASEQGIFQEQQKKQKLKKFLENSTSEEYEDFNPRD